MKLWSVVLVAMLVLVHVDADAKRMGGGKSFGRQSSNVTQREAGGPGAAPAAPAQNAATAAPSRQPGSPNAAAPAAAKKPWGAMLGGLAAGLGLAWLASSLGLGEGFGNILLIALLAMVVFAVIRMVRARASGATAQASPFAFQGAGGASPSQPEMPRQYNPEKVGNDASARPFDHGNMAFTPAASAAGGSMIGSALAGSQSWGVPEGFDTDGFLAAAKRNFVTLQAAWDRADISSLRSMMTDEMVSEIRSQLNEREAHRGEGQPNQTDVVMIEAQLLGIEDVGESYMASVEFSGMIREEPSAGPSPFREVWNMTKPKSGSSGWLVAGVQALQ
ncbi:TIM44-like domain-containing protein [Diaphorobacter ruginosibacter]|uniref:Tim44 domain-containing protein n=1 Tax=Diaphorobacter ruginosibacter TaxID=1715720 RepID=UPI00333F5DA7